MQVRVHGIGGTTPQSMLGAEEHVALVPRWRIDDTKPPSLWVGEDDSVAVYHWAPYTSGSRWFALWPLLLPFTVLNVAGFMHPPDWRGPIARGFHHLLCLLTTAAFGAWLLFAGQLLADGPEWQGAGAAVAVAVVVVCVSQVGSRGYETVPPQGTLARTSTPLADPAFFDGGAHGRLLVVHGAVLAATLVGIVGIALGDDGAAVRDVATDALVLLGAGQVVLVVVVGAVCAQPMRHGAFGFGAFAAASVALGLLGGVVTSVLRSSLGTCPPQFADKTNMPTGCEAVRGPAVALFDAYGWALLVLVGLAVALALRCLLTTAPGERRSDVEELLPTFDARLRARVAQLPRAVAPALVLATLVFVVVGTSFFVARVPATVAEWCRSLPGDVIFEWCERTDLSDGQDWVLTDAPPVRVAQATLYGLVGFVFLNLVRSRGNRAALRRVGQLWDVMTFWPRSFHPFAVRCYAERAVPELQRILGPGVVAPGVEDLTVAAHSQGSILVVAALASLHGGRTAPSVRRLVTFGSPLRTLHAELFPAYVDRGLLDATCAALGPHGRWDNVFRFTDHVGRTVFTAEESPFAAAPGPCSGGDRALADPAPGSAQVNGHSRYWDEVRRLIERVDQG